VGSGFQLPFGLTVDAAGDVFVGDYLNSAIYEVTPSGTQTSLLTLGYPSGLAADAAGNLYFSYGPGPTEVGKLARSQAPSFGFAATDLGQTSSDSPQSVQLQNIGNAPLTASALAVSPNFAQVAGSGTPADCSASSSLIPGASCNLSISFKPLSPGALTGTAMLTDNALNGNPATQAIPLAGIGIATQPIAQISPTTINFGSVPYPGGSTTQNITVTNIGAGTLSGITAASNGPSVKITASTCGSGVTAGNSCTLTVQFAPLYTNGTHTNTIIVTTNGGNATVKTTGYAGAVVPSAKSLDFGTVSRGQTVTLPLNFTNEGVPEAVTVSYTTGSSSFKVASNGCGAGITTGNSCTIEIEFAPTSSGTKNASIRFSPSSGPNYNITLTGTLTP